jgi:hypothetical protein
MYILRRYGILRNHCVKLVNRHIISAKSDESEAVRSINRQVAQIWRDSRLKCA